MKKGFCGGTFFEKQVKTASGREAATRHSPAISIERLFNGKLHPFQKTFPKKFFGD